MLTWLPAILFFALLLFSLAKGRYGVLLVVPLLVGIGVLMGYWLGQVFSVFFGVVALGTLLGNALDTAKPNSLWARWRPQDVDELQSGPYWIARVVSWVVSLAASAGVLATVVAFVSGEPLRWLLLPTTLGLFFVWGRLIQVVEEDEDGVLTSITPGNSGPNICEYCGETLSKRQDACPGCGRVS